MDRLICGDVGFGKTEIAIRAAFKAIQDNKYLCIYQVHDSRVLHNLLHSNLQNLKSFGADEFVEVSARNISPYNSKFEMLVEDLKKYKKQKYAVLAQFLKGAYCFSRIISRTPKRIIRKILHGER